MKKLIQQNGWWLVLAVMLIMSVALFTKVFDNYLDKKGLFSWDVPINLAVERLRTPVMNNFMLLMTLMANWQIVFWGTGLGVILLGIAKKWRYSWALITSLLIGILFTELMKALVGRPRPPVDNALVTASGMAFPSGHSYFAVVFYGLIAYFWVKHFKNIWIKIIIGGLGAGVVLMIGISRIYLGVHWTTDVLAGFSSSLIWLLLTISYLEYKNRFFKEEDKNLNKKMIWKGFWLFTIMWLSGLGWLFLARR